VYGLSSISEDAVQDSLEDGVVHYASSPEPGEIGNSVIVGHSSNNILNSGKYKFAFVLLRRLEKDDTFFIHKDGIRYTYKIYDKKIVPPTDVSVLGPADRTNSMTLITCDPPGTSVNRLIIVAEQISPDPSGNTEAVIDIEPTDEEVELPSNAPTLWSRLTGWL
jgi:sortase A